MRTGSIWKKASLVCTALLLATVQSSAQWVVTDPGNLAQGIINIFEFQPCGRTPQVDYLLC